jgi:indole-3-acetate monooxygenase
VAEPLATARALAPLARAEAERTERERRQPVEIVDALIDSGLCRMHGPRERGGLEADAAVPIEAIEELSKADGATGWCAMIAATSSAVSAYLPSPRRARSSAIRAPSSAIRA